MANKIRYQHVGASFVVVALLTVGTAAARAENSAEETQPILAQADATPVVGSTEDEKNNRVDHEAREVVVEAQQTVAETKAAQAKEAAEKKRSVEEVDNALSGLLQALVDQGVLTREKADALLHDAELKAARDAAHEDKRDARVVRVPYVPEFVLNDLRSQVRGELRSDVVQDVMSQAKQEQWGMPQALPSWISKIQWKGDLRLRGQGDLLSNDNIENTYIDFLTLNDTGGFGKAGQKAFLNTTADRHRLRERVRVAMNAKVSNEIKAGLRLSTGNTRDPVSTNQTLGNYGGRYGVVWDEAYLRYDGLNADRYDWITLRGGRMPNPWVNTDLVWDADLGFDGVVATIRHNLHFSDSLFDQTEDDRQIFFTVGAFSLQEVELTQRDKWLYGAQLGSEFIFDNQSKITFAVAYFDYDNITGVRNALDSNLTDYTAPLFMQKGNLLFDIRNDTDVATDRWALAADYNELNFTLIYDLAAFAPVHVVMAADYVRNIGYDEQDVIARTYGAVQRAGGFAEDERATAPHVDGYQIQLSVGWPNISKRRDWRVFAAYKRLEADAVLDAFTDSDFHLGGTNTKGWLLGGEYGIADNTWLTLRWLSADEITGVPLAIDVLQLDVNAKF